jgi:hypothetical protein
MSSKVVIGVFDDYNDASQAVEGLRQAGFAAKDISLLGKDTDELRPLVSDLHSAEPDKVVTGFTVAGAFGGFLIGLGTLLVPGIGQLVIAGPLLAALSGAAAGSYIGFLTGALAHFDVPETEAKLYETHLTAGKVLIAVHAELPEERFRAEEIMDRFGAIEVDTKAA